MFFYYALSGLFVLLSVYPGLRPGLWYCALSGLCLFIYSFIHSFIHRASPYALLLRPFRALFIHLFIHSFIHRASPYALLLRPYRAFGFYLFTRGCAPGCGIAPFQGFVYSFIYTFIGLHPMLCYCALTKGFVFYLFTRGCAPGYVMAPFKGFKTDVFFYCGHPWFNHNFLSLGAPIIFNIEYNHHPSVSVFLFSPSGELDGGVFLHRIHKSPCMVYRYVWRNAMSQISNV